MKDSFVLFPGLCPCPAMFQSQHDTACAQLLHLDRAFPSEERKGKLLLRALACNCRNYHTRNFPLLAYASQFSSSGEKSPWIYTGQGEPKIYCDFKSASLKPGLLSRCSKNSH